MKCVQLTGKRAISQKLNDVWNKTLRLVLEYVENCRSRVPSSLSVASKIRPSIKHHSYKVAHSFWLCIRTKCLSVCAPSFVAVVRCD